MAEKKSFKGLSLGLNQPGSHSYNESQYWGLSLPELSQPGLRQPCLSVVLAGSRLTWNRNVQCKDDLVFHEV